MKVEFKSDNKKAATTSQGIERETRARCSVVCAKQHGGLYQARGRQDCVESYRRAYHDIKEQDCSTTG